MTGTHKHIIANKIEALDHFHVPIEGGQPKVLRPCRLHQDDTVGVEPIRDDLVKDRDIHRLMETLSRSVLP